MLVKTHKSSRNIDFMAYLTRNPNLGLLNQIQAGSIAQDTIFFHIFSLSMDITRNCEKMETSYLLKKESGLLQKNLFQRKT
jgi:hypothetical protein